MKTLFISQHLWDLVENGCNKDGETADNVRDLRKKDVNALLFIQQVVDDAIFPYIAVAKKAKEDWDTSYKVHQSTKKVVTIKLQTLCKKFESSLMKDVCLEYIS